MTKKASLVLVVLAACLVFSVCVSAIEFPAPSGACIEVSKGVDELNTEGPLVYVPKVKVEPKLDGNLSTGEWDDALCLNTFWHLGKTFKAEGIATYIKYDDEYLYIATTVVDTWQMWKSDLSSFDKGQPWNADAIEIIIVTDGIEGKGYQIIAAPLANNYYYDQTSTINMSGGFDESWNSGAVIANNEPKNEWVFEAKIPWTIKENGCAFLLAINHSKKDPTAFVSTSYNPVNKGGFWNFNLYIKAVLTQ
jgi:hypothetical protein